MLTRPHPPAELLDDDRLELGPRVMPAPELGQWVIDTFISAKGPLHNPAHAHLDEGDIAFLWGSHAFGKAGRTVIGQTEKVAFRAGGWQKVRQEQQMCDWFGRVPTFLITLAADYVSQCSDVDLCALVEHELFHIAHETDAYGMPKFNKQGLPALTIRGHDVEEFIGVVERYGMGDPTQALARLVRAAGQQPSVGRTSIAHACGTCLKAVA